MILGLLCWTQKAWKIKENIDKINIIKIIHFTVWKTLLKKMKDKPQKEKKILAEHKEPTAITDKEGS
jgi:hypothetical protein